ncbi:hypothetical protein ZWY2020_028847 [Hordeum vulgare]|nr:hypothetical protein ZWY2020_028847 [Hordeum vulgare]
MSSEQGRAGCHLAAATTKPSELQPAEEPSSSSCPNKRDSLPPPSRLQLPHRLRKLHGRRHINHHPGFQPRCHRSSLPHHGAAKHDLTAACSTLQSNTQITAAHNHTMELPRTGLLRRRMPHRRGHRGWRSKISPSPSPPSPYAPW